MREAEPSEPGLQAEQSHLLEMIAAGHPLDECLIALVVTISRLLPEVRPCILLADKQRENFNTVVAADLPPSFETGLKGSPINGGCTGTCGEAVFRNQVVICEDIANDERWSQSWRELCLSHGIKACLSAPIQGESIPLASLMLCYDRPRKPAEDEVLAARFFARIASIAFVRERTIEALRTSEERMQMAMQVASCGTWDVDLRTEKSVWSRSTYQMLGYEPRPDGEASIEMWKRAIHPGDLEAALAERKRAMETRDLNHLEYRIIRPDTGETRWISAAGRFFYDTRGNAIRQIGVFFDVTERRRAEQALRRSEAQLRFITDHVPVLIVQCDTEQRFKFVNHAYAARYGLAPDEIVGKTIEEVAGRTAYDSFKHHVEAVLKGERREWEDLIPYEQLGSRWIHASYVPETTAAGEVAGFVAVIQDVTSRKEAEASLKLSQEKLRNADARFREMMESAPVFIWQCDEAGVTFVNRHLLAFFNAKPGDVEGMGWTRFMHPDDHDIYLNRYREAYDGQQRYELLCRFRRHDGEYRWFHNVGTPHLNDEGVFLGFLGCAVDVTDMKNAEESIREANVKAEAASRAKDHFLAQLSHELRTPLTPVLMTAAALREDQRLPEDIRQQLGMIERNVTLEARLIDDLLDLTRITQGKLVLRTEKCDAHALLTMALEIVQDDVREKGIRVALNLQAQNAALAGDGTRLQQVFWNLLGNAVKFTPAGGHVKVATHNDAPSGPGGDTPARLIVEISDDGAGFDPEDAEVLFEPFRQGRHHPGPGLGLGLAIARAVIQLHHGHIRAQSLGQGRGARFTIELPTSEPATAGDAPQQTPAPAPASTTTASESAMRLLVVEDHKPTLDVLTRMLTKAGHSVVSVMTVADAQAAAAGHEFDAVVSDLGLPDGSGTDLMAWLRDTYKLRGIALSGYGMEEDIRRSLASGFIAHLVKPISVLELRRALSRIKGGQ